MSANAQIIFNVLTIIALIGGPIAAIQVQQYLEKRARREASKIAYISGADGDKEYHSLSSPRRSLKRYSNGIFI